MKTELAILLPTMGRAGKLKDVVRNIHEATGVPHEIYFVIEKHDVASGMELARLNEKFFLNELPGCNGAVNYALRRTREPIVICASDDVVFQAGWAEAALGRFTPGIGVVGTNDLHDPMVPSGLFSTHNLVKRAYVLNPGSCADRAGQLYHEYEHGFADVELVFTARARGAFAPCLEAIVEHRQETADATGIKNQESYQRDLAEFRSREHLWAGPLARFEF